MAMHGCARTIVVWLVKKLRGTATDLLPGRLLLCFWFSWCPNACTTWRVGQPIRRAPPANIETPKRSTQRSMQRSTQWTCWGPWRFGTAPADSCRVPSLKAYGRGIRSLEQFHSRQEACKVRSRIRVVRPLHARISLLKGSAKLGCRRSSNLGSDKLNHQPQSQSSDYVGISNNLNLWHADHWDILRTFSWHHNSSAREAHFHSTPWQTLALA